MDLIENLTFDEIQAGDSTTITRIVSRHDLELAAALSGETDFAALDGAAAHAFCRALIEGLLSGRLPGPGTELADQQWRFPAPVAEGDRITATVRVVAKQAGIVRFDCRCINQHRRVVLAARASVRAPAEKQSRRRGEPPDIQVAKHPRYRALIDACAQLPPLAMAIVHPCDRESLLGAIEAAKAGLIQPVLVAPQAKLRDVAAKHGIEGALDWLRPRLEGRRLIGAGHRVVHGDLVYSQPIRLDVGVLAALDALVPLAPLHQPHNLGAIRALARLDPDLPQIACFDTAFHRTHLAVADRFALPRELYDAGVRRYGFHGLSYEYVAETLSSVAPEIAAGRVIVAHLGAGASLCAIASGRSVDSSMGFTALDGLMMGTRTGALDPGVILYLLQERKMDAAAIQHLLYHESGLVGVSGISGDMRVLLVSPDRRAQEAVELFCFRVVKEIGGLAAVLGGLDGLVFTAGIGEHAAGSVPGYAPARRGSASSSTRPPIRVAGRASRHRPAGFPPGWCRPTRSA